MKTISSILTLHKMLVPLHGDNKIIDYLKMDIELEEWNVLPQVISSDMLAIVAKVKQLGVDFHMPNDHGTLEDFQSLVHVIQSVEDAGMIRFDSQYNMWSRVKYPAIKALDGYEGSNCFEIAFYQLLPGSTLIESAYKFKDS